MGTIDRNKSLLALLRAFLLVGRLPTVFRHWGSVCGQGSPRFVAAILLCVVAPIAGESA
jgi:hypothetical protein